MARILAVGNATLDIINVVDGFPPEDAEVRAIAQHHRRGGNTANTLVALSQLGHQCAWAGTLADEPDAQFIRDDLAHYSIGMHAVHVAITGKVPTSYITLNQQNGSRTIVHYRDLDEYPSEAFEKIDLHPFDWLHFEGRNLDAIERMLQHAVKSRPQLPRSIEIEKPRPGIERLFPLANVLLFSKGYAQHRGFANATDFLQAEIDTSKHAKLICAWGEQGAYAIEDSSDVLFTVAHPPQKVVDTIGAGDVFNAGVIDALVKGNTLAQAIVAAAKLAGRKCGGEGITF